jgi:hypothetical protein
MTPSQSKHSLTFLEKMQFRPHRSSLHFNFVPKLEVTLQSQPIQSGSGQSTLMFSRVGEAIEID